MKKGMKIMLISIGTLAVAGVTFYFVRKNIIAKKHRKTIGVINGGIPKPKVSTGSASLNI